MCDLCILVVNVFAFTVSLTADAQDIPGGYVVPAKGTFTCRVSSDGFSVEYEKLNYHGGMTSKLPLATAASLDG